MAGRTTASRLEPGDPFPALEVDSAEGPVALADRWSKASLVIAFMRHFG